MRESHFPPLSVSKLVAAGEAETNTSLSLMCHHTSKRIAQWYPGTWKGNPSSRLVFSQEKLSHPQRVQANDQGVKDRGMAFCS